MIIESNKGYTIFDVRCTKYEVFMLPSKLQISFLAFWGWGLSLHMLKTTLIEATKAGAAEIVRFFNTDFKITNKEGINNPVTEADHASERAIFKVIKSAFPDHYILSEEAGKIVQDSSYKCVSIAVEYNGEIILGAVYNPHMNELFLAEKSKGARLNDKAIKVSTETEVTKACLVTGFPYTYLDMPNGPIEIFERLIRKGVPVRRLGSAAIDLCWVACGRFDKGTCRFLAGT